MLLKQQAQITIKQGWQNEFYLLNLILLEAVDIYQGKATAEHSRIYSRPTNWPTNACFMPCCCIG